MTPDLAVAIILWKRDQHIPVDLFVKLTMAGHNVPHLEAKYRPS